MTYQSRRVTGISAAGIILLAMPGFVFAQGQADGAPAPDAQQQSPATQGGWRRAEEPSLTADAMAQGPGPSEAPPAMSGPRDQFGQPTRREPQAPQAAIPPQLTIKPGTFLTVRIDQPLSSDKNQQGDAFSATLVRPLVVDGVVVAERGQTLVGRVAEAQKAGRVQGVSKLAVELTDLSLVDGLQVPVQTRLVNRSGRTSVGNDAGAVATTTGLGAAVGAAADWGRGAAIGAAAGAAAGVIGVLLTRGHETAIYPESVLTFRVEAPVTVSTERAPQAFRYVDRDDYDRPEELQPRPAPVRASCGWGCAAQYPYGWGYPGYPYYGSGFSVFFGPRYFGGPGYYGRGSYRGFRR